LGGGEGGRSKEERNPEEWTGVAHHPYKKLGSRWKKGGGGMNAGVNGHPNPHTQR